MNFVVRLETVGGGFCYGEIVGNESNDAYDPFRFFVASFIIRSFSSLPFLHFPSPFASVIV